MRRLREISVGCMDNICVRSWLWSSCVERSESLRSVALVLIRVRRTVAGVVGAEENMPFKRNDKVGVRRFCSSWWRRRNSSRTAISAWNLAWTG